MRLIAAVAIAVGFIAASTGTASAASTRINLTLTCDRDLDDIAWLDLHVLPGQAGSVHFECGPGSQSGKRSVRDPQVLDGVVPTGIDVDFFFVRSGGAASMVCEMQDGEPARYDSLPVTVRCEYPDGVGATLVAR
jgi:hypothetical protein